VTRSEQVGVPDLFIQLTASDSPEVRATIREELLLRHKGLAKYLARRFVGRGEAQEDLEQVASLALLKAIDRFDPERGVPFTSFATVTVVGELKRHLRDKAWAVKVPRAVQDLVVQVSREAGAVQQELGRAPTVDELAARLDTTEDQVLEALEAAQAYATDSLDEPAGSGEQMRGETLGAPDERLERAEGWTSVAPLLAQLTERERTILFLRFFKDRTQSEIAGELGISQMHVSRLLARSLSFLRQHAGEG
jgi:RNA polymerase sigma-B factor